MHIEVLKAVDFFENYVTINQSVMQRLVCYVLNTCSTAPDVQNFICFESKDY